VETGDLLFYLVVAERPDEALLLAA